MYLYNIDRQLNPMVITLIDGVDDPNLRTIVALFVLTILCNVTRGVEALKEKPFTCQKW